MANELIDLITEKLPSVASAAMPVHAQVSFSKGDLGAIFGEENFMKSSPCEECATYPELLAAAAAAGAAARVGEASWAHLFRTSPGRPLFDFRTRGGDADSSTVGVDLRRNEAR